MKSKISKVTLLILIFALVLTTMLVPMSAFAGIATGYDSADDVEYVTSGQYIYNWGARGETATFLSPNAEKFYTDSYTFANLSQVSGGTSQSTAPSSALYSQLKTLMTSKQTYVTSYDATRSLFQYTDCQLSGKETKEISSFYSGDLIGPAWDSGSTWNREHTWPDSKGDASGQGENDIMMLRPTAKSENGSRGNTAYGKSSGFYNPNSESDGKYDLRGDVARICLYVYTRWGNTGSMWGSSGVMESLAVLLEWMEADPVDTWELGRNDSVESITGTRNVFVDYPEYAFLLFGEAVPENYPTPSQSNGVTPPDIQEHTCQFSQATCTEPATCSICYATTGSALGHTTPDADGLCTRCSEVLEVKTTHAGTQADPYSIADAIKVGNNLTGSASDKVFVKGVVVTIGTVQSNTYRKGIEIKDSSTNETFYINTANPKKTDELDLAVGDTILLEGYIRINNTTQKPEMGTGPSSTAFTYYSIVEGEQGGGTTHTCVFGDATCTSPATCTCGETQGTALGHTTTNGTCTRCGVAVGSGNQGGQTSQSASIDLTSESNKVSASSQKLEFATGDLKVTVDKANSTTDLVDKTGDGYSARVYAGATLTVEYPQMTKIVINCDSYSYGDKTYYSGFDSMEIAGATITRNELVITITFDQPTDKFVSGSMASQTRILSVEVFTSSNSGQGGGTTHTCVFGDATCTSPATCTCGETQGTALGHTEVVDQAVDATCTEIGLTQGKHCSVCGETLVAQQTVATLGHTEPNSLGQCDRCSTQLVDMQAQIDQFKSAVSAVQNATTTEQQFSAIKVALQQYNALNDTQKAQVTTEFETLKTEVANYNTQATTQNTNSNNALTLVFATASLLAAAVVLIAIKKVF